MGEVPEVLAPCDCYQNDRYPLMPEDPGVGGLHLTFCRAYTMTVEEEIAWRKAKAADG